MRDLNHLIQYRAFMELIWMRPRQRLSPNFSSLDYNLILIHYLFIAAKETRKICRMIRSFNNFIVLSWYTSVRNTENVNKCLMLRNREEKCLNTLYDKISLNTGCSKSKVLKIFDSSAQKYLETKIFKTFILSVTL